LDTAVSPRRITAVEIMVAVFEVVTVKVKGERDRAREIESEE
jgi:hypothetical protein